MSNSYPHWIQYKWWNHDRTDWHWMTLCIVFDAESEGVIVRALEAAGQVIRCLTHAEMLK